MNSYVFVSKYGENAQAKTHVTPHDLMPSVEAYIVTTPEQCDFNIGKIGKIMAADPDTSELSTNNSSENLECSNIPYVSSLETAKSKDSIDPSPFDNYIRNIIQYITNTNIRACNCIVTITCCVFHREPRARVAE